MTKRIILLLDGTWNDSDFGAYDTNIVRMREAISRTLRASGSATTDTEMAVVPNNLKVVSTVTKAKNNIVFYERGVGTGAFLNRYFGGAFGHGLSTNIRRAYKFLSFHYEPGDEIFIFGFSRGAYTARSLVGYLHAAGLLRRDLSIARLRMTGCREFGRLCCRTYTIGRNFGSRCLVCSTRWARSAYP